MGLFLSRRNFAPARGDYEETHFAKLKPY
jgi:hypothetical protein